jgi:hypothetical protein
MIGLSTKDASGFWNAGELAEPGLDIASYASDPKGSVRECRNVELNSGSRSSDASRNREPSLTPRQAGSSAMCPCLADPLRHSAEAFSGVVAQLATRMQKPDVTHAGNLTDRPQLGG